MSLSEQDIKKWYSGMLGLFQSKKGTLCLIILGVASAALFTKHLDGVYYAAIISSIVLIYNYTSHAIDLANIKSRT